VKTARIALKFSQSKIVWFSWTELAQIAVIEKFLPAQLSETEVKLWLQRLLLKLEQVV
jgi:uncharacterized protein YqeY